MLAPDEMRFVEVRLTVELQLDLASLSSVRDFVKEFMRRKKKLHVLVNNAAMMLSCRDLTPKHTADGLEITMATNHFGRFRWTFSLVQYCLFAISK